MVQPPDHIKVSNLTAKQKQSWFTTREIHSVFQTTNLTRFTQGSGLCVNEGE